MTKGGALIFKYPNERALFESGAYSSSGASSIIYGTCRKKWVHLNPNQSLPWLWILESSGL